MDNRRLTKLMKERIRLNAENEASIVRNLDSIRSMGTFLISEYNLLATGMRRVKRQLKKLSETSNDAVFMGEINEILREIDADKD